jgi:hypothetical protein
MRLQAHGLLTGDDMFGLDLFMRFEASTIRIA